MQPMRNQNNNVSEQTRRPEPPEEEGTENTEPVRPHRHHILQEHTTSADSDMTDPANHISIVVDSVNVSAVVTSSDEVTSGHIRHYDADMMAGSPTDHVTTTNGYETARLPTASASLQPTNATTTTVTTINHASTANHASSTLQTTPNYASNYFADFGANAPSGQFAVAQEFNDQRVDSTSGHVTSPNAGVVPVRDGTEPHTGEERRHRNTRFRIRTNDFTDNAPEPGTSSQVPAFARLDDQPSSSQQRSPWASVGFRRTDFEVPRTPSEVSRETRRRERRQRRNNERGLRTWVNQLRRSPNVSNRGDSTPRWSRTITNDVTNVTPTSPPPMAGSRAFPTSNLNSNQTNRPRLPFPYIRPLSLPRIQQIRQQEAQLRRSPADRARDPSPAVMPNAPMFRDIPWHTNVTMTTRIPMLQQTQTMQVSNTIASRDSRIDEAVPGQQTNQPTDVISSNLAEQPIASFQHPLTLPPTTTSGSLQMQTTSGNTTTPALTGLIQPRNQGLAAGSSTFSPAFSQPVHEVETSEDRVVLLFDPTTASEHVTLTSLTPAVSGQQDDHVTSTTPSSSNLAGSSNVNRDLSRSDPPVNISPPRGAVETPASMAVGVDDQSEDGQDNQGEHLITNRQSRERTRRERARGERMRRDSSIPSRMVINRLHIDNRFWCSQQTNTDDVQEEEAEDQEEVTNGPVPRSAMHNRVVNRMERGSLTPQVQGSTLADTSTTVPMSAVVNYDNVHLVPVSAVNPAVNPDGNTATTIVTSIPDTTTSDTTTTVHSTSATYTPATTTTATSTPATSTPAGFATVHSTATSPTTPATISTTNARTTATFGAIRRERARALAQQQTGGLRVPSTSGTPGVIHSIGSPWTALFPGTATTLTTETLARDPGTPVDVDEVVIANRANSESDNGQDDDNNGGGGGAHANNRSRSKFTMPKKNNCPDN